jgi:hypothetical protein
MGPWRAHIEASLAVQRVFVQIGGTALRDSIARFHFTVIEAVLALGHDAFVGIGPAAADFGVVEGAGRTGIESTAPRLGTIERHAGAVAELGVRGTALVETAEVERERTGDGAPSERHGQSAPRRDAHKKAPLTLSSPPIPPAGKGARPTLGPVPGGRLCAGRVKYKTSAVPADASAVALAMSENKALRRISLTLSSGQLGAQVSSARLRSALADSPAQSDAPTATTETPPRT